MGDVIFVGLTFVLFGLAWLLVKACEHIIGPEEVTNIGLAGDHEPDEVAA
jgi:hypothetical protein